MKNEFRLGMLLFPKEKFNKVHLTVKMMVKIMVKNERSWVTLGQNNCNRLCCMAQESDYGSNYIFGCL